MVFAAKTSVTGWPLWAYSRASIRFWAGEELVARIKVGQASRKVPALLTADVMASPPVPLLPTTSSPLGAAPALATRRAMISFRVISDQAMTPSPLLLSATVGYICQP